MIIPKDHRLKIFNDLFKEGVIVAKKDFGAKKHLTIEGVSNLEVLALMRSLKSQKHVTEIFNWQHYYWTLTDQGIQYLRQYLMLPDSVVPSTLRKQAVRTHRGGDREHRGDRHEDGKRTGASGEFRPNFDGERRPRMGPGAYRKDGPPRQPRQPQENSN
ncbi:40S ribosomal protein S10 [Cavenderia fasciculata]|uniref:40S ribosomal protein S10 n=1 Tax=Cavenderia fasciculata TaxID=261658 RepID=F4Q8X8_CACFS|nr:40S ribosomal protein S10 [Cavenderia fasciculata]EGG15147.1 40S ribosomal protein S10 [Cavenderia fasciculata]|eukprot:XP_004351867.1 40S ribosomal protein S10 [Cavenderia fasciculata]